MNISRTILLVLIVIAVVLGYRLLTNDNIDTSEPLTNILQQTEPEEKVETQAENLITDENTSSIELEDSIGGRNSGTAYILREDNLEHYVIAVLPDPEEGTYYEGWLVRNPQTKEFFSTGRMIKDPEGNYTLYYTSPNLYENYNTVIITVEQTADENPERRVLEGTFPQEQV